MKKRITVRARVRAMKARAETGSDGGTVHHVATLRPRKGMGGGSNTGRTPSNSMGRNGGVFVGTEGKTKKG